MHLENAFIQSNLIAFKVYISSLHAFPGNWTHNLVYSFSKTPQKI